jgi:hypothetical protein
MAVVNTNVDVSQHSALLSYPEIDLQLTESIKKLM